STTTITTTTTATTSTVTTTSSTTTTTTMPQCLLDVDRNGRVQVSTDIVYIARHLSSASLSPVPPSFRITDPSIPPDDVISANIDAIRPSLDVDMNGRLQVSTDIVYIARHLSSASLSPVPPSFRITDPSIPPD